MHSYSFWGNFLFPPIFLSTKKLSEKLYGKTILITGASFGIGKELAYQLAEINCHLILVARTEEKLLEIKQEIEKRAAKVSIFTQEELLEWLRSRVARFQLPKEISFVKQMPYTALGKLDKKLLK